MSRDAAGDAGPPHIGPAEAALLVLLSTCWGSAFLFIKLAVGEIPPAIITLGQLAVGAGSLLLLLRARGMAVPEFGPLWGWFAAIGLLADALPFVLIAAAQRHVDAGAAAIVIGATPLITMAIAHVTTRDERLTGRGLAGLALGFAGLVLLIGPSALYGLGEALLSYLLLLGAALSFAGGAVVARRMPAVPVPVAAFGASLLGAAMLFPLAVAADPGLTLAPGWGALAAVAALGLVQIGLAGLVFFTLVRRAGATFTASANYLAPAVALGFGTLLLGEHPSPWTLAAFALICAGLWLAHHRRSDPVSG